MNLFEPLFLLLVLVTLLTLLTAGAHVIGGRPGKAGRILRRLGIGAAIYFAVVIGTSIAQPGRTFAVGEPQCFDDWCIAVEGSRRPADAPGVIDVDLRVSSRARRVPMGERGAGVYLIDARGRRFDPKTRASDTPLDTKLQPGESLDATRRFQVPADASGLAIVYTHVGGFPIGWLIVSEGGWFQKPSLMKID